MIIYENENARLLIENGAEDLTTHVDYFKTDTSLYITEETALSIYNTYYKHEIENPIVTINNKTNRLIPIVRMKTI